MAFRLERERTRTTPYVLIDEENRYMKFEGECFLEDILVFFKEINEWLSVYLVSEDFTELTFDCAMEYFNSSTTKLLYNLFGMMDSHAVNGKRVIVNWIASEEDDMLIECGEDFKEDMENLEFNLIVNG